MSLKTQSILKVVDIDRLKPEKNQQVNTSTGVGTNQEWSTAFVASSFSEEYLKTEPEFESKMFSNTDCEFFQDLVQWCSAPVKEELVHTIDSPKITAERAYNTDTLHTPFSPQGWDVIDAKSTDCQTSFYNTTSNEVLSPNVEVFPHLDSVYSLNLEKDKKSISQEQFLDINSLPVVIGDLASEEVVDTNPWPAESVEWTTTLATDYTKINTHNTMPFIDQEDSLDLSSVIPREVESNDVIITEYIINDDQGKGDLDKTGVESRSGGLSLNVTAKAPFWPSDVISTPEVLSYVEQLEKEKCSLQSLDQTNVRPVEDIGFVSTDTCSKTTEPPLDYEIDTPKSEPHSHVESEAEGEKPLCGKRRHHDSEDSDETYTPYSERSTPRKYKRKKPNVPIKDLIIALEGSQQLTKARRGRPPKRRESNVSSMCSTEESSSVISNQDVKYRELRDKNNEASKRSRMNRKLKELQIEQLALELEERNKKLKVRADILEDMTKKLKDALMTAILHK